MAISIHIQTLSIILAVQSTSYSLTPSHRRYGLQWQLQWAQTLYIWM